MSKGPDKVKITVPKVFKLEEVFEDPPVKTKARAQTLSFP